MDDVIGDILAPAIGVAVSPVPIIAVILMLMAPDARESSIAFMLGWITGITLVVTVVALVIDPVDDGDSSDPSTFTSVLLMVLGLAALLLARRQWRGRPRAGQEATLPGWMAAIDSVTPVRAAGLGLLLAAVNPKNLTLGLAGGVAIGGGDLDATETTIAIVVFVILASCSIAVPVIGYLVASARMRGPLDELRGWLAQNNAAVMTVLMLVIGVTLVGKSLPGIF